MSTPVLASPYIYEPLGGFGGGYRPHPSAVTPTFEGIRQILALEKRDLSVHESARSLLSQLERIEKSAAMILNQELLEVKEGGDMDKKVVGESHAIALFVVKKAKCVQIFMNDNAYYDDEIPYLFKEAFRDVPIQFFVPNFSRLTTVFTCQVRAIDDCKRLSEAVAQQILEMNGFERVSKEGVYRIKVFPPLLREMTPVREKAELKRYLVALLALKTMPPSSPLVPKCERFIQQLEESLDEA